MVKPSDTKTKQWQKDRQAHREKKMMIPNSQSLEIKRIINMIIIPYNK